MKVSSLLFSSCVRFGACTDVGGEKQRRITLYRDFLINLKDEDEVEEEEGTDKEGRTTTKQEEEEEGSELLYRRTLEEEMEVVRVGMEEEGALSLGSEGVNSSRLNSNSSSNNRGRMEGEEDRMVVEETEVDMIAVGPILEVGTEEVKGEEVGEEGMGVEVEVEEIVMAEEDATMGCVEGTHSLVSRTRSIRLEETVEEEVGTVGAVEDAEEAEVEVVEVGISSPSVFCMPFNRLASPPLLGSTLAHSNGTVGFSCPGWGVNATVLRVSREVASKGDRYWGFSVARGRVREDAVGRGALSAASKVPHCNAKEIPLWDTVAENSGRFYCGSWERHEMNRYRGQCYTSGIGSVCELNQWNAPRRGRA